MSEPRAAAFVLELVGGPKCGEVVALPEQCREYPIMMLHDPWAPLAAPIAAQFTNFAVSTGLYVRRSANSHYFDWQGWDPGLTGKGTDR